MYSASIVLFNTPFSVVAQLIEKLISDHSLHRLYLIDNGGNFDVSQIVEKYPEFAQERMILFNKQGNLGYGAGHNLAFFHTKNDFHFVINPDIFIEDDTLSTLVKIMESDDRIGQVMPKIVYPDGELQPLCKLVPTPLDLFIRRFFQRWYKGSIRELKYTLFAYKYDRSLFVPNLSGCFMGVRMDLVRAIGGFDERFFMYLEDVDFTRRMATISNTLCVPTVLVKHEYAKKSYQNLLSMIFHAKSAIKYFNKWGWLFDAERDKLNNRCLKQFDL